MKKFFLLSILFIASIASAQATVAGHCPFQDSDSVIGPFDDLLCDTNPTVTTDNPNFKVVTVCHGRILDKGVASGATFYLTVGDLVFQEGMGPIGSLGEFSNVVLDAVGTKRSDNMVTCNFTQNYGKASGAYVSQMYSKSGRYIISLAFTGGTFAQITTRETLDWVSGLKK